MNSSRREVIGSWTALERQIRNAFSEWANYRIHVFNKTECDDRISDGRYTRLTQLIEAADSAELMAQAWSATLDAGSSIAKAQYLAGVLRTGESLAHFFDRVLRYMQGEIGLLPLIRDAYESSQPAKYSGRGRELLFRRYERGLPSYDIPMNIDLMVESALYALYVAHSPASKVVVPDNRKELWRAISVDESTLCVVTPRRFEELVGYIYERLGCRTEVTEATRDHGADVLAWQPGPFGTESLIVVQTKLYSGENKVDLAGVHALHGAVAHYNAQHGHLVATSDITGPARQFLEARGYTFIDLSTLRNEVEAMLE